MIERVKTAIQQSQTILDMMPESEEKKHVAFALSMLKTIAKDIEDNNMPCPPHLVEKVDEALKGIEELYQKTASN